MRIAITGASGFVGARVVRALADTPHDVYAIVRPTSDLGRLSEHPRRQLVEADFCTVPGRLRIAELRPDVCIHCAWTTTPGEYLADESNLDLLAATLELARALADSSRPRFVGVGTCFEYDLNPGYLAESTPLAPTHLYSAAKAATYLTLRQFAIARGISFAWARLFYLYGPTEHPRRLVASVARALLRGEPALATKGEQVRDFLHVDDAGGAIAAVATSDVDGAVNIGSGEPVTVAQIVVRLGELSGRPDLVRLGELAYTPRDPMFVCANVERLRTATGWSPRWSLGNGLRDALAWWRSAGQPVPTTPAPQHTSPRRPRAGAEE
jgi:nucleoside-diphosphate-sugar epimerase